MESEKFFLHLEEMGEKNMAWGVLVLYLFLERMSCIWRKYLVIF